MHQPCRVRQSFQFLRILYFESLLFIPGNLYPPNNTIDFLKSLNLLQTLDSYLLNLSNSSTIADVETRSDKIDQTPALRPSTVLHLSGCLFTNHISVPLPTKHPGYGASIVYSYQHLCGVTYTTCCKCVSSLVKSSQSKCR